MSKVCLAVGQFIILIIIRLFIDLEKGTSLPHNALRMFRKHTPDYIVINVESSVMKKTVTEFFFLKTRMKWPSRLAD